MQFVEYICTWITSIWCAIFTWKQNVGKAYSNLGVYNHSKIVSLLWWSGYVIGLHLYRSGYHLYESLVTKQQWKGEDLSFEFRSYYCMVAIPHLYAWSLKLWLMFQHWIPDCIQVRMMENIRIHSWILKEILVTLCVFVMKYCTKVDLSMKAQNIFCVWTLVTNCCYIKSF